MESLIGKTLGNYRIESVIGTGGMGQVFRAAHIHLAREAAIKVLHANLAAEPGFQARFLKEARAVASLKHPNIVEVYDFGEQAGSFYLVMELIDGGSLRQLLSQIMAQAGLPLWTGLDLVRQTADGLALAHASGMVHRDVKPDNLLLSNTVDGNQLVKITDFGLVRLAESEAMTAAGSVLGTAAYLSPEQCQGLELDGRSDLYSLGVVLYEVATGYVPFQAKTLSAAVYHHVQVEPPPPRTIRPDLPLELEKIIMRCLAKRPEERYSSAAELSSALRTVVPGVNQATITPHYVRAPEPPADNTVTVVQQRSRRNAQFPPPALSLDSAMTAAPGAPSVRLYDQTGKVLQRVELTADGITIGRAPDNNLCYESTDLSRNHLRINLEGQRVTVTDLGSSNGTYLEGIRLLPQVAQVWEGSEPLRLGSLWLGLEQASPLKQSVAVGSSSRPSGSNQIEVALDSKTMALTPGQPAKCKVSLVNLEEIVDHISLEVVGVPAQCVEGTAGEVQLNPGMQATVLLTVLVPRESTSRAGDYPVTIRARSRENPGDPGTAEATWTVLPFAAMSVKTTPAKAGGRREAAYKVTLRNEGNAPARYVLSAQDDEETLVFLFEASSSKTLSQITVDVAPGDAPVIKLRVGAGRRWFGKTEAHSFSVQAVPENKKDAQVSSARFMHQPLIPTWVMVVAPFVLIGLVLLVSASGSDLTLFALVVLALFVVVFVLIIQRLPDITRADYRRVWAINQQPGATFQRQSPPTSDSGRSNAAPFSPAMSTGEPAPPAAGPRSVGQDFYARVLSDPTPDAPQAAQVIESLRMRVHPRLSAYLRRIIFLLLGLPIVAIVLFQFLEYKLRQIGVLGESEIARGDAAVWAALLTCIFVTFAGLWLISLRMGVRSSSLPYFVRFLILLLLAPIMGVVLFLILWLSMFPFHGQSIEVEISRSAATWYIIVPLILIVPSLCLILLIIRVKSTLITIDRGRLEIATGVLSKNISNIEPDRIVDLSLRRTILNRMTGDGSLILSVEQWRKPPQKVVLRGLAKWDRLDAIFSNLRNLVQILRRENRGKGRVE